MSEENIEIEIRNHLKMVQIESAKETFEYFKAKKKLLENKRKKTRDENYED